MILRFARTAEDDLEKIGDVIARDNPARAFSFVAELRQAAVGLREFPRRFPLLSTNGEIENRRRVHGRYHIHYQICPDSIVVTRVTHSAIDTDV